MPVSHSFESIYLGSALLTTTGNSLYVNGRVVSGSGGGGTGDFQPLDSDLTAIAALATSGFGRSLLTVGSASGLVDTMSGFVANFISPSGDAIMYYKRSDDTFRSGTMGYGLQFSGGTLSVTGITGGGGGSSDTTYLAKLNAANDFAGNTLTNFNAIQNSQVGTTYTLVTGDNSKMLTFDNTGTVTVICPHTMRSGFSCGLLAMGTGIVQLTGVSGAAIRNRLSGTKLAGQYAMGTVYVAKNTSGIFAEYYFGGDVSA